MSRSILFFIVFCSVASQCVHSVPRDFAVVLADTDQSDQNEQFDQALKTIASVISPKVSIGDIEAFSGIVTIKDTELLNLTSLSRVGDATVTTTSAGIHIKGKVTFTKLEADIGDLAIDIPILPTIGGGSAVISIGTNQVSVDVVIAETDEKCTVTVNQFELTQLGNIDVTFGTSSIINWIVEYIAPTYLNAFAGSLVFLVGDSVTAIAQSILSSLNICGSSAMAA